MTFYFHPRSRRFSLQAYADAMRELGQDLDLDVFLPVDLRSTADAYELKAFLPAVSAEDVEIQVVIPKAEEARSKTIKIQTK